MLIACLVCMFLSNVATGVCLCFTKKDGWGFYAAKTLSLISLICFGISVAAYKNNFSGFILLLLLSVVAMFLTLLNLQNKKNEESPEQDISDENVQISQKKNKKTLKLEKIALFLPKLAFPLSSLCVAFASLYIGKETAFGMLLGVSLALALTFLTLIIKKVKKKDIFKELADKFLIFIGGGLAIGSIIPVLLYSLSITNIIFSIGLVVYALYFILEVFLNKKYDFLAYILGTMIMFSAILF